MDPCPVGAPSFREVQCKEHNNKPFKGKLLQWRAYLMAGDTSSTNQDCEKNDGDSQPDKGKISGKIFRFPREINSKLGDKSICSTKKLPSEEEILTTIYKCREQAIETAKNFGIHLEDECEWIIVSLPIVKNIEVDNGLDENEDEDERDDVEPSVEHNSQDNPCVLYCLNNENTFAKLEPRVKDGTRCKPGTKDMCISGVCKKIGCDGQMDSDAVEDVCGICNGDGTRCDVIDKIFKDPPGNGYVKVVTVPAGSRKVVFEEIAPSENTIAVSDTDQSKYFLNGGYGEQLDGEVNFGDFQGIYTHPESQKEKLIINGPLTKDLLLQVAFFKPENVGYRYKYATKSTAATYTPKYHWEQNDWEECSNRCGGGFRTAIYNCIEEKSGKVSDKFCEDQEKPEKMTEACNEQPCKTKWKVGRWGQCHACKYKSGVRIREVECVRESNRYGHDDILVEDSECEGAKPGTRELCNSHKKCKERRFTDGLPDDLMEDVWKQIHVRAARESPDDNWVEHEHREEQQETSTVLDKKNCHSKTDTTDDEPWNSSKDSNESIANDKDLNGNHTNNELSNGYNTNNKDSKGNHTHEMPPNIGKVIKDRVPENEIKLIEVPLKQSPMNMDLSDNAFETVGDQISDSLDTDKARIVKGKAAADVMKKLQHQHEEKENQHHHHDEKERRKESNKVTGSSEKPTK